MTLPLHRSRGAKQSEAGRGSSRGPRASPQRCRRGRPSTRAAPPPRAPPRSAPIGCAPPRAAPARAPAALPAAGPLRFSERRGCRAPLGSLRCALLRLHRSAPGSPQRGQRRPRPMRRRGACGLGLQQSAGCAPALPGLSLPSRQGTAGLGRWGLRVLEEMGRGSGVCLGLEGEDVLAAAVLRCSSGMKFIGFCFAAGSDRRFVRHSVFSCLE